MDNNNPNPYQPAPEPQLQPQPYPAQVDQSSQYQPSNNQSAWSPTGDDASMFAPPANDSNQEPVNSGVSPTDSSPMSESQPAQQQFQPQPQQAPVPQPIQQPFAPQPQQVFAPQPQQSFTPQSTGSSGTKKLLIILGAVFGGLTIIGVTVAVLMTVFFSVSKEDYISASNQYNNVVKEGGELGSNLSTVMGSVFSATDNEFERNVSAARKSLEKTELERQKLAEQKAFRAGEGRRTFMVYNKKLIGTLDYTGNTLTSLEKLREIGKVCEDDSLVDYTRMNTIVTFYDQCVSTIDSSGSVRNEDINNYLLKYKEEMKKASSLASQLAGITDPYSQRQQILSISNQLAEMSSNVATLASELNTNLSQGVEDASPAAEAEVLVKFLEQKIE